MPQSFIDEDLRQSGRRGGEPVVHGRRLTTSSTAALVLVERAIRVAGGFVISGLVARHLGADQFGQWSWSIALAAIVAPIGLLGFEGILAREFLDAPEQAGEIASSAVLARLAGAAVSILVGTTIWAFLGARVPAAVVLLSLLSNLCLFSEVIELRMLAERRLVFVSAARLVTLVAFGAARLLGLAREWGLPSFVLLSFLEVGFQACLMAVAYRFAGFRWNLPKMGRLARLLKESWPFLAASVAVLAYMKLSQLLVERFADFHAVGLYSMALRICEVGAIVPIVIVQASVPDLHFVLRDSGKTRKIPVGVERYFQKIFWSGTLVALGIVLTGNYWIPAFLGSDFTKLGEILWIQSLAIVPMGIGAARTTLLSMERQSGAYLFSVGIGAACSLGMSAVVLPRFGIVGMAWVNVVSFWLAAHFAAAILPGQRRLFLAISRSPFHKFWKTTA